MLPTVPIYDRNNIQLICKLTIGGKGLIIPNISFSSLGNGSNTMCSSMIKGVEKSTISALFFVKAMGMNDISNPLERISDVFPDVLHSDFGSMWLSTPSMVPLGDTLRTFASASKK